jgi:hypothetical protein
MDIPAPGRVTEDTLHVTEDTGLYEGTNERQRLRERRKEAKTHGNERTEGVRDEGTAVEEGDAETKLVLGVPGGENHESSGEECRLNETKEEAGEEGADEVGGDSSEDRDGTPDDDTLRERMSQF